MFATAVHFGRERHFSMVENIKTFIDPRVSIGSIVMLVFNAALAIAYVTSDHKDIGQLTKNLDDATFKIDAISNQVPVVLKTIEINGSRISDLEHEEHDIENRINTLENEYGIAHNDLEGLKQSYRDIIAASQARSPVYRAHN
jgi:peptidoglycan hydrolase CwlO-like protein